MLPKGFSCWTDFSTQAALYTTGGYMAGFYMIVHVSLALGRVIALNTFEKSIRVHLYLGLDQIIQLVKNS